MKNYAMRASLRRQIAVVLVLLLAGVGAARAKDVRIVEISEGFSLIFDDFRWEDGALCISYSAAAPDDGETYLLVLSTPRLEVDPSLRGERSVIELAYRNGPEDRLLVLGGDRANRTTGTLWFDGIDPSLSVRTDMLVSVTGVFLRALQPVDETDIAAFGTDFSGESLARAGVGVITAQRDEGIVLDATVFANNTFDALAETRFDMDGYSVEILKFHADLRRAECALRITREGGIRQGDPLVRSCALLYEGGRRMAFNGSLSSSCTLMDDGALEIRCLAEGEISLYPGDQVLLVPVDAEGNYQMDEAVALTPVS